MLTEYRECAKLVLDTNDDPNMTFDEEGICNHYHYYYVAAKENIKTGVEAENEIKKIIDFAKKNKHGRYDCVIGVSGGVDSTYLLYLTKKLGLNPLAVHLDNGWDSELAVKNIETVTGKLGIDLETYVINWNEFKDLQRSYFFAGVIDLELPTDHAIYGAMYKVAAEKNIRVILSGVNIVSESVMPHHWYYSILDFVNIRDIQKRFGTVKLDNFPLVDNKLREKIKSSDIKIFRLLDCIPYLVKDVEAILISELGWKPYGGKHFESIFTRFFQGYILPRKFGVDKRKAHLSNLICSGQITKNEAKEMLSVTDYPEDMQKADREYVLKKLGFTDSFFDEYLKAKEIPHTAYLHENSSFYDMHPVFGMLRPLGLMVKKYFKINYRPIKRI